MSYKYSLPKSGASKADVLKRLDAFTEMEPDMLHGRMTSYAMRGDEALQDVVHESFSRYFGHNALVRRYFPGFMQIEEEVISTVSSLISGGVDGIVTMLTSGGTESNFCGAHAAREWAKENLPHIKEPEIVAPYSIHPTFAKGCHYLGIKLTRVPLTDECRGDPEAIAAAISENTIGLAGSAPCWPHGLYDPIDKLAAIAKERGLWMHVDACVGGFMAPFVERAGYPVPPWDFRVPGVMSVSGDAHKYGYAAKPLSTINFRSEDLLQYHYVHPKEWPSSRYMAQAFSGSRPAGSTASLWGAFNYLGEEGYVDLARRAMENKQKLVDGIAAIDGLKPWNTDLTILVYGSDEIPVEQISGGMGKLGWPPAGTLEPPLMHLVIDAATEEAVDLYLRDLRLVVEKIKAGEDIEEGSLSYVD